MPLTPRQLFALSLVLALAACAAPERKRRSSMSFQVERDSDLYAPALRAAAAWSKATGSDVFVSEDGDIPIFRTAQTECITLPDQPVGTCVGASSPGAGTPDARVEVPSYMPVKLLEVVLLHEMGHCLRGDSAHLARSGAIMSERFDAAAQLPVLTREDVLFICQKWGCDGRRSEGLPPGEEAGST